MMAPQGIPVLSVAWLKACVRTKRLLPPSPSHCVRAPPQGGHVDGCGFAGLRIMLAGSGDKHESLVGLLAHAGATLQAHDVHDDMEGARKPDLIITGAYVYSSR